MATDENDPSWLSESVPIEASVTTDIPTTQNKPYSDVPPSWLNELEPDVSVDPRMNVAVDPFVVWQDATEDTQENNSAKDDAVGCGDACAVIVAKGLLVIMFCIVVALEVYRSYVLWCAWLSKRALDSANNSWPDKEAGNCRSCLHSLYLIFVGTCYVVFYLSSICGLICQVLCIELFAAMSFCFCGLIAFSREHGMATWRRTRDIGHRIREAMAKRCRPEETSSENQEPEEVNGTEHVETNWEHTTNSATDVEAGPVVAQPVVAVPVAEPIREGIEKGH